MAKMIYGIAGNTAKDELWPLIQRLVAWMETEEINYQLHTPIAEGLLERSLISAECAEKVSSDALAGTSSIILSIGEMEPFCIQPLKLVELAFQFWESTLDISDFWPMLKPAGSSTHCTY